MVWQKARQSFLRSVFSGCSTTPRTVILVWLAGLGLSGCAGMGGLGKDAPPEVKRNVVQQRAEARWQAILKGDYAAAYGYLSPASRQSVALPAFEARMRGAQLRGAKVDAVDCGDESCKVAISITYDHRLMKGITTPAQETWVISDGQAWYVWQL
jgi:hypothetical protein